MMGLMMGAQELTVNVVIIKYQLLSQMNKSIAKTRNELERITYKINQLKTKYTAQSHPHQPHHPNIQNNPMDDSYQQQYSDQRGPSSSNREHVVVNRLMQTSINFNQPKNKPNNGPDDVYHKEFKVFRNEIYNYVDKCLIMGKEREQEIIEKAVQNIMGTSRGRPTTERQDRIRKIQQETTNCVSSIQDVLAQVKKNQKSMGERIACAEYKLKKQIKELSSKLEQVNLSSLQQYVEQLIESKNNGKQKERPQVLEKFNEKMMDEINKMNETQQRFQKDMEQIKLIMVNWQQDRDDGKSIDAHLITQISQSVLNQIKDWTNKSLSQVDQRIEQIASAVSKSTELETKLSQYGSLKPMIQQVVRKLHEVESKQKQNEKSMQEQLVNTKQQLLQSIPEVELIGKQIQINIQTSYLKPRLEQLKRQLATKFNQQIEFNKQDLMINVEETVFEKINKFCLQEKQRRSPKLDIDQSKLVLKQDLKDIQAQLKSLVGQHIEDKLQKHFSKAMIKTEALDTSLNISLRQRTLTLEEQQAQTKKTQEIIEGKLNQFETDINQTIKLLYEDIENRVNQMLGHCGISELKTDIESLKRQMRDIQTKVKSLTLIATTNPPPLVQQGLQQSVQFFETLRSEVYTDMGCQIDKISNILERTVEEMEGKVQKLDRNFSYVYERMSKIEYDNANFKDQLALKSSLSSPKAETKTETIVKTSSNQLLDALGQYNAGRYFFESG